MKREYLVKGAVSKKMISELILPDKEDQGTGAVSIFIGRVRDDVCEGKKVVAIEYSAYEEMVEKEAGRIIKIVKSAFSDVNEVIIKHSEGMVNAGEASLFIMVTAGHRDQASRACRHTLEMVKESLPVWKKEFFNDNTSGWK